MRESYVLRTGEHKNEYFLDHIKPCEEFYMDAFSCDCFKMTCKEYENLDQNCIEFFKTLTEREVNITILCYGFLGKKHSVNEIAKALQVLPKRVVELKNRVIYKANRTNMMGYCRPTRTPVTMYEHSDSQIIDYRKILIDELIVLLNERRTPEHYLKRILEKNKLTVKYGREEIKGINIVAIEDMDLSVRTYNCLKRAGINDLIDLLSLKEEELCKIRNLGSKSLQEIQSKREKYVSEIDKLDLSKIDKKYITIEVSKDSQYKKFKIPNISKERIAELVYDILVDEYSEWKPIINYNLSTGLKNLLLIRGSLFVENILDDYSRILNELTFLGYQEYVNEFTWFVDRIRKHTESGYNQMISVIRINRETKDRIMSDRVSNTKVFADLYLKKDEKYKKMMSNLFFDSNIKIELSEKKVCKDSYEMFLAQEISQRITEIDEENEKDVEFEDFFDFDIEVDTYEDI